VRPRGRPELEDLAPYKTSDVASGRIFLHANENPFPPPDGVLDEIYATARKRDLNRYPDARADELVAELASYAGVDASQIWVGDGANEVLLQACLAYGGPGRKAMLFTPTYPMHYRQPRMAGTDLITVPRDGDMTVDAYIAVEAIDATQPDIVFLCTPNNPTGTVIPLEDIQRIAETAPGLVIVDEAYHEFCGETFVGELPRFDNVLVVRTMSKAFRLASVRLGYGIANPGLLEEMRRVRMPYGQSAFTQIAATIALRRRDELLETVDVLMSERERMAAELRASSEVYPSGANFLLFRHPDAEGLLRALGEREIVIRDFRTLEGCEGCLRVSVGTPEENDEFLDVLASLPDGPGSH
jgi:histidinol-phosphate aminotransferase